MVTENSVLFGPLPESDETSGLHDPPPGSRRAPGDEPIPGYRLVEPLGRGGFGEVWKCEAPGGLLKAVKFVLPDPTRMHLDGGQALRLEFEAFQQIKQIRHPFILQVERVELLPHELVMVMELADSQLQERYDSCVASGLPGIPRDELLGYFIDAAEALDVMTTKYGLQHLDVKPANLFLVGGHVKVGDYGLVTQLEATNHTIMNRGLTPRYVAPEVLNGEIHSTSDQYSLALVYTELLTGVFPYNGHTTAQLMLQHVTGTPNLATLPPADRASVLRALSKKPEERFPTCTDFVHAMMLATPPPGEHEPAPASHFAIELVRRKRTSPVPQAKPTSPTETKTLPNMPGLTMPRGTLPPLRSPDIASKTTTQRPSQHEVLQATPGPVPTPPVPGMGTPTPSLDGVVLNRIFAVIAVDHLQGKSPVEDGYVAEEFVQAIVTEAAGWDPPKDPTAVLRLPDGNWGCRFPTAIPTAVIPHKLTPLVEIGLCQEVSQPSPDRLLLRVRAPDRSGGWSIRSRQTAGALVEVTLPPRQHRGGLHTLTQAQTALGNQPQAPNATPPGEIRMLGELYGNPDPEFVRWAADGVPHLMREVRRALQTVDERRSARRLPYEGPLVLYPVTPEGLVMNSIRGMCVNVSMGGLLCNMASTPSTRYVYVQFPGVEPAKNLAILTRIIRTHRQDNVVQMAGRFRLDL